MPIQGIVRALVSVTSTIPTPPENRGGAVTDSVDRYFNFDEGVAAGEADLIWSDRITLAAGGTTVIDLLGGGLNNVFGAAQNFAEVTALLVYNRSSTAGDILTIGPGVAPWLGPWAAAGNRCNINPQGFVFFYNDTGWAAVAGVSDQFTITETGGANPVDYDIIIVGRSS